MNSPDIPSPNPRDLLPPLLECLMTASASKQPPEGLLPLLSPILAQRVRLIASDRWLSLLCWNKEVASRLPEIVNAIHVEPHPSSGEIELEGEVKTVFRRSDAETLHARITVAELGLVVTYLWCTGGEGGNAWKLSDLRGLNDEYDGTEWFPTIEQADDCGLRRSLSATTVNDSAEARGMTICQPEDDVDDDDSYWALYDKTPGRTPARTPMPKKSPAPFAQSQPHGTTQSQEEYDYFEQYAQVQPDSDPHDPDFEDPAGAESSLNGNALGLHPDGAVKGVNGGSQTAAFDSPREKGNTNGVNGHSATNGHSGIHEGSSRNSRADEREAEYASLNHPRTSSPLSTDSVERLERRAEQRSQTEHSIKQFISTDIKNLFRLARSNGIDREEFERIIQREMEVLPMLEQDD